MNRRKLLAAFGACALGAPFASFALGIAIPSAVLVRADEVVQ